MIVVCELLPSGKVHQSAYPDERRRLSRRRVSASASASTAMPGMPPWGSPLEWAMRFAGLALRDLKHPCWIEERDRPASRLTID
jgi:hypothetical protein